MLFCKNIKWTWTSTLLEQQQQEQQQQGIVLSKWISNLQANDTLIVVKLDRFCRDTKQALNLVADIQQKQAHFISLDVNSAPTTLSCSANLTFQMIAAIAEFETARHRERQLEGIGIQQAKKNKQYKGRKPKITTE